METEFSIDLLEHLKNEYYNENGGKNNIFKKKQKTEIAKIICSQFPLEILLKNTIYRIKNQNIIYIDYKMFKLFANESIYEETVNYVFYLFNDTITKYGNMNVQLNMDTITVSATERYKDIIILFNKQCVNTQFVYHLNKWCIYNAPSFIDSYLSILKLLIDQNIMQNLTLYSKEESPLLIKKILEPGIE